MRDTAFRAGLWLRRASIAGALAPLLLVPQQGRSAAAEAARAETVEQALCRLITDAAAKQNLPPAFLTRLIWQESSFRANAISPAGAQGLAQFMPGTAADRGLLDPFDPEQAIPASAALLADLSRRFGNLGLAAAAYNGGPARVSAWLRGTGTLPYETSNYVFRITGQSAEAWAEAARNPAAPPPAIADAGNCLAVLADRKHTPAANPVTEAALAPWGVQLSGNFSKALALSSFERARLRYASVLGDVRPMIIGTRFMTRGYRAFYRVRIPAASRDGAAALCNRIHAVHGSCVVLRS